MVGHSGRGCRLRKSHDAAGSVCASHWLGIRPLDVPGIRTPLLFCNRVISIPRILNVYPLLRWPLITGMGVPISQRPLESSSDLAEGLECGPSYTLLDLPEVLR
jgi:hypothetical protein